MMRHSLCCHISITVLFLAGVGLITSCHKNGFLNKKPNTTLVVPSTLADFQALLDNTAVIGMTPILGEVSADDFYLNYSFWQTLDTREQNAYLWAPDIYGGQGQVDDWDVPYQQVFYANVILEGLSNVKIDSANAVQWNTVQGSAFFTRAYAFYNLAQLFAPVYDSVTAANDLGIPLRIHSDITAVSVRASVQATYQQILDDLHRAEGLLSTTIPFANRNRPSRPAAQALLARVYLSARNYALAGSSADSCLRSYGNLIDYNTLDTNASIPIKFLNNEALYQSSFLNYTEVLIGNAFPDCVIDSGLYRSYANNDLRRLIFYRTTMTGSPFLKGSYNGTVFPFSGLATDEMYLVRAECEARAGDITNAMTDLNTLLRDRWRTGTFIPVTAYSPANALDTILAERRKELAFRGLRWTDLRRLNKGGANIVLTRNLNGMPYHLSPNSLLYTLTIPPDVLTFSQIKDNPR